MRTTCTYTECPDYGCHCLQSQITELQAENERLREALEEVVRISDRKHDAWDRAKEALKRARGEDND